MLKSIIHIGNHKVKTSKVSVSQAMDDHLSFEIRCDGQQLGDPNGRLSADELYEYVGKDVKIAIEGKDEEVQFLGVVIKIFLGKTNYHFDEVVIIGQGKTVFVDGRKESNSFYEQKIDDIVTEVLESANKILSVDVQSPVTIPYVTQYRESPYKFISRLAFKYGYWFYYNGEKLIFTDNQEENSVDLKIGPEIDQFDLHLNMLPIDYRTKFYDYLNDEYYEVNSTDLSEPTMDKYGQATLDASRSMYNTQCNIMHTSLINSDSELNDFMQHRLNSGAAQIMVLGGSSLHLGIKLGTKLNVKTHDNKNVGSYIVNRIQHYLAEGGTYSNSFFAIPAILGTPPPSRNVVIPKAHMQIAKVKDQADPDSLGRVKVQFPWQKDGETTPWIRIATPYAGAGDHYFIPEVDDQVMVAFEHENPDRPFVLGSLYHGGESAAILY